jgi:2-methylaconitate cis-trans-isomerase PrpF
MIPIARYPNAQLTAPGNGTSFNIGQLGAPSAICRVVVAAINTNVTVRVEQSDTPVFTVVQQRTPNVVLTENGNYEIDYQPRFPFVRVVFVAETGGTAATLDCTHELFRLN